MKYYILDTNVILYDSQAIYSFDKHNIIIPIIVLEELDRFKKGNDVINRNARDFVRILRGIFQQAQDGLVPSISPEHGTIEVKIDEFEIEHPSPIFNSLNDNKILAMCLNLQNNNKDKEYILVSKDINLQMKARALGINSQDYDLGNIAQDNFMYQGYRVISGCEENYIDSLYSCHSTPVHEKIKNPIPNEFYILRNGKQSALGFYSAEKNKIIGFTSTPISNIRARNVEQEFAIQALLNPDIRLVTLTGKAGTGKTLLALAGAIEQRSYFNQILLARPNVPLSNKGIGYLPGDVEEKVSPFLAPLYDNLKFIKKLTSGPNNCSEVDSMLEKRKIEIEALTFIRGRSLSHMFFIIDEAQNLTPHEVKTIITRAGEGTKIILTGDIHQIDHPYLDSTSNGLSYLIAKMKNQEMFAHVNLTKSERSELAELAGNLL